MIQAAHWRRGGGPDGREPIASSGDVVSLAINCPKTPQTWGKITSRPHPSRSELEFLAFRMGVSVASLQRAINMGLFHG